MAIEYTSSAHLVLPAAAASLTIAPDSNQWTNGSYVEVTAALGADRYLVGVVIFFGAGGVPPASYELDIAIGAAASEVVTDTLRFNARNSVNVNGDPNGWCRLPVPSDQYPSGARVAARLRVGGFFQNGACHLALVFLPKPLTGSVRTTTNPLKAMPAATLLSLTATTPWANSAYVEVTAATANAIILGAIAANVVASTEYELDVATGAAGVEVVKTTLRSYHGNTTQDAGHGYHVLNPLFDNIGSGVRVAIRIRASLANGQVFGLGLNYYDQAGF